MPLLSMERMLLPTAGTKTPNIICTNGFLQFDVVAYFCCFQDLTLVSFPTQEEKWAYWSRHIYYNRYDVAPGKPYLDLYALLKDKNYFILTTNVDHQFWLAGFPDERIFATQGDYGLFQCAKACHKKLYNNETQVRAMVARQKNCRIPSELVPRCPV